MQSHPPLPSDTRCAHGLGVQFCGADLPLAGGWEEEGLQRQDPWHPREQRGSSQNGHGAAVQGGHRDSLGLGRRRVISIWARMPSPRPLWLQGIFQLTEWGCSCPLRCWRVTGIPSRASLPHPPAHQPHVCWCGREGNPAAPDLTLLPPLTSRLSCSRSLSPPSIRQAWSLGREAGLRSPETAFCVVSRLCSLPAEQPWAGYLPFLGLEFLHVEKAGNKQILREVNEIIQSKPLE